jgi:hypothetical protein
MGSISRFAHREKGQTTSQHDCRSLIAPVLFVWYTRSWGISITELRHMSLQTRNRHHFAEMICGAIDAYLVAQNRQRFILNVCLVAPVAEQMETKTSGKRAAKTAED